MDQVFYKLNHSIGLSLLYKTIYNSSKSISNFIITLFLSGYKHIYAYIPVNTQVKAKK